MYFKGVSAIITREIKSSKCGEVLHSTTYPDVFLTDEALYEID